jgi:serine/threonine-protein kinase
MVLGRQYQRELDLARRIDNEELRTARIRQIEVELREPALAHLQSGKRSSLEAPGYAEALIAFYGGDLEDALAATRSAFASQEWLYEAKRLEGDILLEMGADMRMRSDNDGAMQAFEDAGRAFAIAANIARSDPSIYEGECGRWTQIMEIRSRRGASVLEAFDEAAAACSQSLEIDSERFAIHERLSYLYWRWADIVNDRGGDPDVFLARSIAAADTAIALQPESSPAYFTRGGALTVTALNALSTGDDPRPALEEAIASFENAIAIDPGAVLANDDLGYAWERMAMYEMGIGLDPRPSLDRAVEAFRRAIELNSDYANAYNNSGIALWRRAVYEMRTGSDPSETLAAAIGSYDAAIDRNPDYAYAHANRGLAGRTLALFDLQKRQDPTATIDRARSDLQRALSLNPQIFWAYPELSAIEILAARWAMENESSPQDFFTAAESAVENALAANPQNSVAYQNAAEIHRWRAEWRRRLGQSVRADLIAGQQLVEQALARNPGSANAMVTQAALKAIQAETETDPQIRRALAAEASVSLDRALEANQLLELETEGLRERIEALAASPAASARL